MRLGLNLPLFIAAQIAIGTGTLVGMVGIWGAAAWGRPVPEWEKVGHAHSSWWAILIMIAAMVLPSLQLKAWVKRLIVAGTFIGPTFWTGVLASYYEIGGPRIWRFEVIEAPGVYYELPLLGLIAGVLEFLGFLSLLIVALSASGINIPLLSSKEAPRSKYNLLSHIEVPRKIFLVPALVNAVGVVSGFIMTAIYKISHRAISPAALVQFHDHLALISTSALLTLIVLSVLGIGGRVFNLAYRLMQVSLPLVLAGLAAFVFAGLPSMVWVIPAGIYYLLLLLGFSASVGFISKGSSGEGLGEQPGHAPAFRAAMAVSFAALAFLIAVGAYLAVTWNTSPDITVTYKQPEGAPYPGPYPERYAGTAPAKGTPRGLENAHLSPGSWLHVSLIWLTILMLVGGQLLNRPGILYLYAATIPMAPLFNILGRFLAWLGVPNGIGALWFAGHPLKGFNLISLFIIALIVAYRISQEAGRAQAGPSTRPHINQI